MMATDNFYTWLKFSDILFEEDNNGNLYLYVQGSKILVKGPLFDTISKAMDGSSAIDVTQPVYDGAPITYTRQNIGVIIKGIEVNDGTQIHKL